MPFALRSCKSWSRIWPAGADVRLLASLLVRIPLDTSSCNNGSAVGFDETLVEAGPGADVAAVVEPGVLFGEGLASLPKANATDGRRHSTKSPANIRGKVGSINYPPEFEISNTLSVGCTDPLRL